MSFFACWRSKNISSGSSCVRVTRGSVVKSADIEENVRFGPIECHIESLKIGRGSYAPALRVLGFCQSLTIGRYCSFGSGIIIVGGEGRHLPQRMSTYPFPVLDPFRDIPMEVVYPDGSFKKSTVTIGHDVWIGHNAVIAKGITIGNGAVIGIGAIVTKDVPAYAIVAGNPAVVKKFRHDDETIALLEKSAWWNWPVDKIKNEIALFRLEGAELKAALKRH